MVWSRSRFGSSCPVTDCSNQLQSRIWIQAFRLLMLLHKIITSHRFTDLDLLQSHPRWNLDHLKAHWCLSWLELTSRGFTWSGAWRACSGVGRLAMVGLRAGHRVGEEVRQRTQPRHNRVGLRRPKLSGASLLSSTSSYVSSSNIQDSTLRPHVQKRFWR